MKTHKRRLQAYAGAIALILGGGCTAKWIETTAGLALVAAGVYLIGKRR